MQNSPFIGKIKQIPKMEKEVFKPYIPAEKNIAELTVTSIIIGILLTIIFGAANAYLGLRVGMTVSASIPAAVVSMAIIRLILKRNSILENNIVQTIGSAGGSLAAGCIFTMPAFFLWAKDGVMDVPSLVELTLIALFGGILGVLFMIPLRDALIVKEHCTLPYPEGTACAKVLLASEEKKTSAFSVFWGMGVAAVIKFVVDGLNIATGIITIPIKALKTAFSVEAYPALIGVGYICGIRVSAMLFAGSILGWFVLIPAIVIFGENTVLFPATTSIGELYANNGAEAIWSYYVRYIGAGAVAMGGIICLIKSTPLIVKTFKETFKGFVHTTASCNSRTEQSISTRNCAIGVGVIVLLLWLIPIIQISFLGAILVIIFGFTFCAVTSRIVGIVGSTNNPASGMTIATVLATCFLLKLAGETGSHGMRCAITIVAIICTIITTSSDTSQDLKTGFLLGATPKKQQIGEIIGVVASSLTIAIVLILLNNAWEFGSAQIAAPQATLMKTLIEGVMDGNVPWSLIFIGAFIAIVIETMGISSLTVAIGLYLPFGLNTAIMVGGLIRFLVEKKNKNSSSDNSKGILFCSGLIAGEGILGIVLAGIAICKLSGTINLSNIINTGAIGGAVLFILLGAAIYYVGQKKD